MIPVKLPKEVLNLFPMWEYRCPSCSTYVESGRSFCPNCKMSFDERKWRIPPRFLKSHGAMSEYAHKVLVPKLSPEQRQLLLRYFTEFLNSGWEDSGGSDITDGGKWSGSTTGGGASITVQSTQVHHGTYAAEATRSAAESWAVVYKELDSGQSILYHRAYVRFTATPASGNFEQIMGIMDLGMTYHLATCELYNDSGTVKWRLHYFLDASADNYALSSTPTISTDQWYCIELYFKQSSGSDDGEVKLYVDGTERISQTNLDNDSQSAQNSYCGIYSSATLDFTCYYDCVVVADTYIGPESVTQTYTKTWQADTLFQKLGIQKSLSLDTAFQKQDIPVTLSLDAAFQKDFTIQKQIDALLQKLDILETFGIDVDFLKRDVIRSFAVDASFSALATRTISRQIDVLLRRLDLPRTFGLDVYFGSVAAETYGKTFGLDVVFAYKVRLPDLWLDEEGRIVLNISKPYMWVGS